MELWTEELANLGKMAGSKTILYVLGVLAPTTRRSSPDIHLNEVSGDW
jgi:hypothetical protein